MTARIDIQFVHPLLQTDMKARIDMFSVVHTSSQTDMMVVLIGTTPVIHSSVLIDMMEQIEMKQFRLTPLNAKMVGASKRLRRQIQDM